MDAVRECDSLMMEGRGSRRYGRALLLLENGRLEEAAAELKAHLAEEPYDLYALNRIAFVLQELGKVEEAASYIERALRVDSSDTRTSYLRAMNVLASAGPRKALPLLEEHVRAHPGDEYGWNSYAFALKELGRYDEAMEALSRAMELSSGHPYHCNGMAVLLSCAGRREEALEWVERGLAVSPSNQALLDTKGRLLLGCGRAEEAAAVFKRLMEAYPDSPVGYAGMGWTLSELGSWREARVCFLDAMRRGESDWRILWGIGETYREEGVWDKAVEYLEKAWDEGASGGDAQVLCALGEAYEGAGKVLKALDCYERLCSLRPDDSMGWYLWGRLLLHQGYPARAVPKLERALELAPGDVYVANLLCEALVARGDVRGACRIVEAMLARGEEDVKSLVQLVRCRLLLGDREGARKAFGRLERLTASLPEAERRRWRRELELLEYELGG